LVIITASCQKLKNPFLDRPDYQPNRAPKRPNATVNKFRFLSLPPKTVKSLHTAFLLSFPTESQLRLWVQFEINENLDQIKKSNADLPTIVLDLFYWIEARGVWRQTLIAGEEATSYPSLQKECTEALQAFFAVTTIQTALPTVSPSPELFIWEEDPFVDRETFQIDIEELFSSDLKRVAMVNGPPKSGKSYCGTLLDHRSRKRWPNAALILLDLKEERRSRAIRPEELCRWLVLKSRVDHVGDPPPPLPNQKAVNWAGDLAAWAAGVIPRAGDHVWVVLDGFDDPDVPVETHAFIGALAAEAADQRSGFRLVLLDYNKGLSSRTERATRRTTIDYISASDLSQFLALLDVNHQVSSRPEWAVAQEFVSLYSQHTPGSATQIDALHEVFPDIVRALLT